jgi:hypothetical protein
MDASERKKATVITKYAADAFTEGDWYTLGQITGKLKLVTDHPRLLRAMGFGDDDYEYWAAQVLDEIFSADTSLIPEVIDHFDIDLWYEQKEPDKFRRLFRTAATPSADFWTEGYLKLFISHLSANKFRMSVIKGRLAQWGVCAFIAHEDIQASREWMNEIEAGLATMDVLVAVVEPGFKESDWCAQEVGYALGRRIDIIPLRAGLDPFGFFGKYQGIQIKGKRPQQVADEIVQIVLRKPKHRGQVLQAMSRSMSSLNSKLKTELIGLLDSWALVKDERLKELLERLSLSEFERSEMQDLIARVGAFAFPAPTAADISTDDNLPF